MKMKKYISMLLAIVMIAGVFSTTSFAAEIEGPVNEVIVGGESSETRASKPPSDFYNLGGTNQYTATLIDLAANRGSYTKYYFATSTDKIHLKCELERSGTTTNKNRELIIYLYEKNSASASGSLVATATVNFTTAEHTAWFVCNNLDSNKFYYFRFFNNSSTDPGSSMDISGSIIIDDTSI